MEEALRQRDRQIESLLSRADRSDRELAKLKQERSLLSEQKKAWWRVFPSRDFYTALCLAMALFTFVLETMSSGVNKDRLDSLQRFIDIAMRLQMSGEETLE